MALLTVRSQAQYAQAIRQFFPNGEFWDKQFDDTDSDLYRWCQAKAAELVRLKSRRACLLSEGFPSTTTEMVDDWERILDLDNSSSTLEQRQQALTSISMGSIRRSQIETACGIFGATLDDLVFPYTPAFFARTRFRSRLATPAAWSTIWLYISLPDSTQRTNLETNLTKILLANSIISFFYKGDDGAYHHVS